MPKSTSYPRFFRGPPSSLSEHLSQLAIQISLVIACLLPVIPTKLVTSTKKNEVSFLVYVSAVTNPISEAEQRLNKYFLNEWASELIINQLLMWGDEVSFNHYGCHVLCYTRLGKSFINRSWSTGNIPQTVKNIAFVFSESIRLTLKICLKCEAIVM